MKNLHILMLIVAFVIAGCGYTQANEIIHDAEYYVLEAQHGEKWVAQDKEISKKLAALKKNTEGRPISSTSCGTIPPSAKSASPTFRKIAGSQLRT